MDLTPFSDYSSKLFAYFGYFNITNYDQDLCLSLCYQDKLLEKCNCTSLTTQHIRNSSHHCFSYTEQDCKDKFDLYFSKSDPKIVCEDVCREECSKVTYKLLTSQATYPTSVEYLNAILTLLKIRFPSLVANLSLIQSNAAYANQFADQSLLKVTINYDQNLYTTITESPKMDVESLLAISMLTFIEIIVVILEMSTLFFCKKESQPRQSEKVSSTKA
jgi:hypothetical protein